MRGARSFESAACTRDCELRDALSVLGAAPRRVPGTAHRVLPHFTCMRHVPIIQGSFPADPPLPTQPLTGVLA